MPWLLVFLVYIGIIFILSVKVHFPKEEVVEPIKIDPVLEKALIAAREELDEIDRIFYDQADEVALISKDKVELTAPVGKIIPKNHHIEILPADLVDDEVLRQRQELREKRDKLRQQYSNVHFEEIARCYPHSVDDLVRASKTVALCDINAKVLLKRAREVLVKSELPYINLGMKAHYQYLFEEIMNGYDRIFNRRRDLLLIESYWSNAKELDPNPFQQDFENGEKEERILAEVTVLKYNLKKEQEFLKRKILQRDAAIGNERGRR